MSRKFSILSRTESAVSALAASAFAVVTVGVVLGGDDHRTTFGLTRTDLPASAGSLLPSPRFAPETGISATRSSDGWRFSFQFRRMRCRAHLRLVLLAVSTDDPAWP